MRRGGAHLLTALGALLIAAGLLAGVVNREVLDGSRFAQHADAIRTDSTVARQVGLVISTEVIAQQPELIALRPLLETAATAVVSSPSLGPLVRTTIAPLHRALVSGSDDEVVLRLADVGALLVAAITTIAPDTQAVIPDDLDVTLSSIGSRQLTSDLISTAHTVALLSWLLPLLGVVALLAACALRRRDRRAWLEVVRRGLLGVTGLLALITLLIGLVVGRFDTDTLGGALVQAAWHELDGAFWRWVIVVGIAALVVTLVSRSGLRLSRQALRAELTSWIDGSRLTPGERLARAALVVLAGVALILEPLTVLALLAGAVGVVLVLAALRDLGAATLAALPRLAARLRPAALRGFALGLAAAVVVATVVVGAWPGGTSLPTASASGDGTACNGHVELCTRPYNDVAFPATHNSMSAADGRGWFLAEQPTGVMGQLDAGIRVFLIDSWPAQATSQPSINANTEASRATALAQARTDFGTEVVDSALRLRDALNLTPRGEVKPYLCHALCELGSTEWIPLMQQVRSWMETHPREVVTFFIQDEVSPTDTATVFDKAGLLPYVYTPEAGRPWPTLEQMIDSGRRIVVLHEHHVDSRVPWILDGEVWSQDTPYDFRKASQFSCARFRGPANAPLFLVNHWLSNPGSRVADAAVVNAEPVLLARLKECQAERGQIPNFVAVDNYDKGDLIASVDALNGFG
ncbi:hypothetical protein [Nocardioides sp.]|uniref:hypothetical protein n=1 Tax=Nocardioides sp. TaxID=35761 RepID=UPI00262317DF|nr:hypothetical protein [Nocardioides sp.]